MKAFRRITAVFLIIAALIFAAANLFLNNLDSHQTGRPYRVEINRLALEIEQNGIESVDLSSCEYVYNIAEFDEDFYNSSSDSAIREIGGRLYRFDYKSENEHDDSVIILIVNVFLAVMTVLVFAALIYIRARLLKPFESFSELPFELAKGNLTKPVKENKSRFFGRFLWGIDLLREDIESRKLRELSLQKEKKTLLLSLSHDIKTPLSAIKLYSKALSKNLYSDAQKQREIAESINAKADEIEGYVTQIINASREDFLSLEVDNSEFYLSDLIGRITDYYSEKFALIKTEFKVGEYRNCLIFGDLERSVEVLQNILENAVKYGDGRRVEILFPENDEGVLITVKNSGCTLEKTDILHIFESFYRGANAENIKGSGLGLYICRQLMHKMDGEIFAEIDGDDLSVSTVFSRA